MLLSDFRVGICKGIIVHFGLELYIFNIFLNLCTRTPLRLTELKTLNRQKRLHVASAQKIDALIYEFLGMLTKPSTSRKTGSAYILLLSC